jgi:serine/threonine-protein kinase ULK/ATG1
MEFCSGSDLSIYIKNRGKLPTLDYVPRRSTNGDKVFWPHPASGGIDERVARCFLGQLGEWASILERRTKKLM